MSHGQCPKCSSVLKHVNADHISVKSGTNSWPGISFLCPYCAVILSVGFDPRALKAETVVKDI